MTESKYEIDKNLKYSIIKMNSLRIFYEKSKNKGESWRNKNLIL